LSTRLHTWACSPLRFREIAAHLARTEQADLVLSAPGYPAETTPIIGICPVTELIFDGDTTPDDVREFCFGSPGLSMGYVSYDYGMILRNIPSSKPRHMSLGHLKKYAATIEYKASTGQAVLSCVDSGILDSVTGVIEQPVSIAAIFDAMPCTPPDISLDQAAYEQGVRQTLEHIRSGLTYQLNLSTRLTWYCPGLDPLSLFLHLEHRHPAPFYAWYNSGDHRILSTSPERFIQVADGLVLSQPIKGTLRSEDDSPETIKRLTESPKERAELSMIVDLIRNDISANCEYGSVRVDNHLSVFRVDNLLQMYSDVTGRLRSDRDCLDLFFDAFPGGSITGCPKRSSMAIIEELEPHARGIYCGSMVVIRDRLNMDSSIAIRTAVFDTVSNTLDTYAGSGIVVDSTPTSEYEETMAKAEKFFRTAPQ